MRTTMMTPTEITLCDERIALRIQVAIATERGCAPLEIAALEAEIVAIDKRLKLTKH